MKWKDWKHNIKIGEPGVPENTAQKLKFQISELTKVNGLALYVGFDGPSDSCVQVPQIIGEPAQQKICSGAIAKRRPEVPLLEVATP